MYWTEFYRPKNIESLIGNENARIAVIKWLSKWIPGTKPLLLIGPPGVGKTTIAHILAIQFNYDLIDLNASDSRSRLQLEKLLTPTLDNSNIFLKKTMIFLDEVDGVSSRDDFGGYDVLIKFIKNSRIPIILASNSINYKMKSLSKLCKSIKFYPIQKNLIFIFLKDILNQQNQYLNRSDMIKIIDSSNGDIRKLLNLTQSYYSGYNNIIKQNYMVDISDGIENYFKSTVKNEAKKSLSIIDGYYFDPRFGISTEDRRRDILQALFNSIVTSNLPLSDLSLLLDSLSHIDIHIGRISPKRNWRLLKYINDIVIKLMFPYIINKNIKYNQYNISWPLMGTIFSRGQSTRKIISEMSKLFHVQKSVFGVLYFPFLLKILESNKVDLFEFIHELGLEEKYITVLEKELSRSIRLT
ncbi:MAG: AAA family ATPase [Nitrososphaeraceae archaeon]